MTGEFTLWYSRVGADQGRPFKLLDTATGEIHEVATVRFAGTVKSVFHPEGLPYPDGPRGALLLEGTVILDGA